MLLKDYIYQVVICSFCFISVVDGFPKMCCLLSQLNLEGLHNEVTKIPYPPIVEGAAPNLLIISLYFGYFPLRGRIGGKAQTLVQQLYLLPIKLFDPRRINPVHHFRVLVPQLAGDE